MIMMMKSRRRKKKRNMDIIESISRRKINLIFLDEDN